MQVTLWHNQLMAVSSRTYDQLCPVAVSLDVLGDRWTMLLLRDLLWRGPHGYQELLDANPGLSPTLLSERLSSLAEQGLIEKIEVRDGRRSGIFRLTALGKGVEPIIEALYGFAAGFMTEIPLSEAKLEYLLSLSAGNLGMGLFELDAHTVRLAVDGVAVIVEMAPGRIEAVEPADDVEGTVIMTQAALMALAAGAAGAPAEVAGEPAATDQLLTVLGRASG